MTEIDPADQPPTWRRVALMAVALLALIAAIYVPALGNDFVLDDDILVTDNPNITEVEGLERTWLSTRQLDYWPVTYTALWLEWRAFGRDPAGYHVVSLVLHWLSSLLLWLVLRRLRVPGAPWAALLFAVHPVNVESVAWVVQRKNTLAMLFALASLWAWLRGDEGRARDDRIAAGLLFVLALLSKTSVVMLPVVMLALLWWRHGRLSRGDLVRTAPFFGLSLVFGLITLWFQHHRVIGWNLVRSDSPISRTLGAAKAVWFYLGKAFAPVGLKVVYPRWLIDPGAVLWWLPLIALVGLLAVLLWQRRRIGRGSAAALIIFAANLVPVMGFASIHFMKLSFVADHWQYFSLPAALAWAVATVSWASQRWQPWGPKLAAGLGVLALGGCVALSSAHIAVFDGKEAFGQAAVAGAPDSPPSWYMLGATLDAKGKSNEAQVAFERGMAASVARLHHASREPHIYADHATLLLAAGSTDQARGYLDKAVQAMPGNAKAHFQLGELYAKAGDIAGALAQYRAGVAARPKIGRGHIRLGVALAFSGDKAGAIEHLGVGLGLDDRDARANAMLAVLLAERGDREGAIAHFERALELDPKLPPETRVRLQRLKEQR